MPSIPMPGRWLHFPVDKLNLNSNTPHGLPTGQPDKASYYTLRKPGFISGISERLIFELDSRFVCDFAYMVSEQRALFEQTTSTHSHFLNFTLKMPQEAVFFFVKMLPKFLHKQTFLRAPGDR